LNVLDIKELVRRRKCYCTILGSRNARENDKYASSVTI